MPDADKENQAVKLQVPGQDPPRLPGEDEEPVGVPEKGKTKLR